MAEDFKLIDILDVDCTRPIIQSIYGAPRTGKTHQAIELTPGKVIAVLPLDTNSLPVASKRAKQFKELYGGERNVVIPLDKDGTPFTLNASAPQAVMNDIAGCQAFFRKVITRLNDFLDSILPRVDGIVIDNDTDIQAIYDFACYGAVGRPNIRDVSPRNKLISQYYQRLISSGCHVTLIHKSANRWFTEKKGDKTEMSVIGTEPDLFSKSDYHFNAMFSLEKVESHLLPKISADVSKVAKNYKTRGFVVNPKQPCPRTLQTGDILLRCLNTTQDAGLNASNTMWVSRVDDPNDLDYPDSITMPNVFAWIYPEVDPSFWYEKRPGRK